jgi:dynein heavy chain
VRAFDKYGEVEKTEQFAEQARALDEELARARDTAESINAEEALFSLPVTKFAQIAHMKDGLDPYLKLWGTAAGFKTSEQEWMNSPFMNLDPEKIDNEVRFRLIFE